MNNDILILKSAIDGIKENSCKGTLNALWNIKFQLSNRNYETAENICNRLLYKHESKDAVEDCINYLKMIIAETITDDELETIIEEFICDNKDHIAEQLFCLCPEFIVNVNVDENGEIYNFIHRGNTSDEGIRIISERGSNYPHECNDCQFCDWKAEKIEEAGYDLDITSIRTLVKEGAIDDDFADDDLSMSVNEYRNQCYITYTLSDDIEYKSEELAWEMVETYGRKRLVGAFF